MKPVFILDAIARHGGPDGWTPRGVVKRIAEESGSHNSQISYHLGGLVFNGLLEREERGSWRAYRVTAPVQTPEIGKSRMTYHRGFLAFDRLADPALDRMAARLLHFAEKGEVTLVQRRHGDGDYEYLAVTA